MIQSHKRRTKYERRLFLSRITFRKHQERGKLNVVDRRHLGLDRCGSRSYHLMTNIGRIILVAGAILSWGRDSSMMGTQARQQWGSPLFR